MESITHGIHIYENEGEIACGASPAAMYAAIREQKRMPKCYAGVTQKIINAPGGSDNIEAVTHCTTRLRFVIRDDSAVDTATLKSVSGVLDVVKNQNQCQVIIGNTVSQACAEVLKLLPENLQCAIQNSSASIRIINNYQKNIFINHKMPAPREMYPDWASPCSYPVA